LLHRFEGMAREHRVVPPWMAAWLEPRGFGTSFSDADENGGLTGVAVQDGWRPMSALGQACFEGHLRAAQWLYAHGCGPHATCGNSFNGATPMWYAPPSFVEPANMQAPIRGRWLASKCPHPFS
jgi:hypothetical protein